MSLFRFTRRTAPEQQAEPIPPNSARGGVAGTGVSPETALRNSAVWACLRLRADLVSTMPVKVYRDVAGVPVETGRVAVQFTSGGVPISHREALYATQFDLDRSGNCFGVITERDGLGLPARIELANLRDVAVRPHRDPVTGRDTLKVRVGSTTYDYDEVWHERQYTVAGLPVGLDPIGYAAYTLSAQQSALQFALDWFNNSAMPALEIVNTKKEVPAKQAEEIKTRAQTALTPGGVFVHGNDWEIKPVTSQVAQAQYLDLIRAGVPDVARFFGCPADLIDGAVSGSSLTYANIGQRNQQLLIMHLDPAITRREDAWSRHLLPAPRYIKLNRSKVLAMDPATRAATLKVQLDSRQITPSEARAIEDRPPLTEADLAEFAAVYGGPRSTPTEATA